MVTDQVSMSEAPQTLVSRLEEVRHSFHRLVMLVGPPGSGKTDVLLRVAERTGGRRINLNLALSRRLLELAGEQRAIRLLVELEAAVGDGVPSGDDTPLLLDHIEILFDPTLQQDPLGALRGLSRSRTVVAAWCGSANGGYLVYAEPGHPEYCRCPGGDIPVVCLGSSE